MLRGINTAGALFLCICLLAAGARAGEEVDDFADLDLEELLDVVVTASKHEQDIAESPSAISVITRQQIDNTSCTDVVCLLRQVPGVDVMEITPMYPAVGAQALTDNLGNKILVLVDGREINNEILGFPFWQSMSVHLADIERIEVIRGPGSALYGANAHSGVVSIITRTAVEHTAEVFIGAGEHDHRSLHARMGQQFGNWRLLLSGGLVTTDNWRIRGLRERLVGRSRLVVIRETGSAASTLQLSLTSLEGVYTTSIAPLWLRDGMLFYTSLSHQTDWLKALVSFNTAQSDIDLDMLLEYNGAVLGKAPDSLKAFNSNLDAEVQLNHSFFKDNLLIAGCNYRWITFFSDDNEPAETHQHRIGVFLHDEQRLAERLLLTAGLRFDYNNITPNTLSPRVAGVWQFVDNHYLRLAFGMAFRKPNFLNTSMHMKGFKGEPGFPELEQFFLDSLGNENVGNESVTSFEAGYRGRFLDNRFNVEVVGFYNLYRDGIRNVVDVRISEFGLPDLSNSSIKFQNGGREVDCLGGSVSLSFRMKKKFHLHANYTYRFSWYVKDSTDPVAIMEGGKGDRVPFEPAHLANAAFHYLAENGLRTGLDMHMRSSSDVANPKEGGPFDPYILVHNPTSFFISGFLAWRIRQEAGWAELGVRAYNVFHMGFRDMPAVLRPDGRTEGGELIGRRIFLYMRGAI